MKNSFCISDINVTDAVSNQNTGGFKDGNTNPALDDYEYDANDFRVKDFEKVFCEETERSSMVKDRNKGIASISYNYLNLPERIEWSANKFITYQYNAAGQKVTKTVRSNDSIKVVRYLDGFQYAGDILQFFPHAEGYVKATPVGNANPDLPPTGYAYNYTFNYTDHLGNIRLSYTKDPQSGTLQILDENHYYPFGLRHEVYVTGSKRQHGFGNDGGGGDIDDVELINVLRTDYQYKYNGKEFQDELGLSWYDYGARNYDAAIGRWMNYDPLAEVSRRFSPYAYALNNPLVFVDPDGMKAEDWRDKNGNKMSSDQLKDVKVYIFYNPDSDGFSDQTMKQYAQYEEQYGKGSVAISDAMTEADFAQDWGDMEGSPDLIVANHHGSDQQLHLNVDPDGNEKTLDGHYIVSTNSGKTNKSDTPGTKVSDLPTPKADLSNSTMLLNTCNSNNPSSNMKAGTTLAKEFSKSVGTVRGTNKSVNFNSSGNPTTQWYYGGTWQFFQNGKQVGNPAFKSMYDPQTNPGLKKPGEM